MLQIEFVKQWGSNVPGRIVDAGPGGAITEGQADLLVLRGIARPATLPEVTTPPDDAKPTGAKSTKKRG